ncbi:MAG: ribosomal protein S18-alanine N-acetyltransferase [Lachnospiraceae bacterium]|nr:ribosomal protein S18-alanine N-acetyltransferase [Lachnospiraceae bacterium]MDD3615522.1 ribosomal protein S18-alanine N-acetyltransferase [Lachnospiraceae bacterium]
MITIRRMEIDDLEQVMPIENANFSRPWTETGYFTYLIRSDAVFLVAEEEQKICGYCGALLISGESEVTNVSVEKSFWGQGIGKKLMEQLCIECKKEGVTLMHLEVRASNKRAITLYEHMGFAADGLRKNYYEDPKEDAVLMTRAL